MKIGQADKLLTGLSTDVDKKKNRVGKKKNNNIRKIKLKTGMLDD